MPQQKLSSERTTRVIWRLKGIFLDKWDRQFRTPSGDFDQGLADQAFEEWQIGLGGMTDDHIMVALDHCRNNLDWPPSIHDFKEAGNPRGYFTEPAYQEFPKALPKPKATEKLREIAKRAAADLKHDDEGQGRTTRNIENGTWTEDKERIFQQHCKALGIDAGNPLGLDL